MGMVGWTGTMSKTDGEKQSYWLIWDGNCEFCRRSVAWVKARDRDHVFRALPYQDAPSPPMTPELLERARHAVQVVLPDGTEIEAGRAVAFVLNALGYRRLARMMGWRWMRPLIEMGYRWVARNRGWLGKFLLKGY
jgi:predicted DCC family thiol-disulfide oxidoreductase YuxK